MPSERLISAPAQPVTRWARQSYSAAIVYAFQHFRNAYPGETGERNVFRVPGYFVLDMGLGKTFHLNGLLGENS